MIYICQGHEKSIGLEIFFKSFILISKNQAKSFTLIVDKPTLEKQLKLLDFKFRINNDYVQLSTTTIRCIFTERNHLPLSTSSLQKALEIINPKTDFLLTLPTSKDQLILNNTQMKGYTEFFRSYYQIPEIAMMFYSDRDQFLLISDHLPLKKLSKQLTAEFIFNKTKLAIDNYQKYFEKLDQIIFAGINPHAGEKGLLGKEDDRVGDAIDKLQRHYPELSLLGPLSGDILHFHKNANISQLFVYMYHDQGLPVFKKEHGLLGLNISLGLPFLRLSVDHGTAFELYGKNSAEYMGCYYMLKSALNIQQKLPPKGSI